MKTKMLQILRWSERYTRTDMRYLAEGGFWVTANCVLQVALGLVTTIALANLLPKEALGTFQFILCQATIIILRSCHSVHSRLQSICPAEFEA